MVEEKRNTDQMVTADKPLISKPNIPNEQDQRSIPTYVSKVKPKK